MERKQSGAGAMAGVTSVLSAIVTPMLLVVTYVLVFTPIGIVKRALGMNAMVRKLDGGSYFVKRARKASASMERMS